jgi:hypothetical protein
MAGNGIHTERRYDLVVFLTACLAGFFPSIGISISFCPAEALRIFLPFTAGSVARTLWRSASIRSMTFSPRSRAFAVIGLIVLKADSAASHGRHFSCTAASQRVNFPVEPVLLFSQSAPRGFHALVSIVARFVSRTLGKPRAILRVL